jgi:hypothetical protein
MAVREFDGTDDEITLDDGGLGQICNGAWSAVLVVKPTTVPASGEECFLAAHASGTHIFGFYDANNGKLGFASSAAFTNYFASGLTASAWQIIAVTKAAGTVAPRAHCKELGAGSWTHGDMGATVADRTETATSFVAGSRGGVEYKDTRIAVAAYYVGTNLSDANVESIQTTPSTQQLITLGASAVWEFDQASTATAVEDLVGIADQSGITGTTVVGGDDPSGWTFFVDAFVSGGSVVRSGRHRGRYPARDADWY